MSRGEGTRHPDDGGQASEEQRRHPVLGRDLGAEIERAHRRLKRLSQVPGESDDDERNVVDDLLEVFATTLEELQVASEELRQQNDELTAAYQDLEVARWQYRDLFEFAPDAYFVTTPQGVVERANHAALAMLKRTPVELEGRPLVLQIVPDERATFHRQMNRLLRADPGRRFEWESRVLVKDVGQVAVLIAATPLYDLQGALQGMRWLWRDITVLKDAQLALVAAEREALLGRLAASLAHEIGNPLQSVIGALQLAEEVTGSDGAELRGYLDLAMNEVRRAGNIVGRLRRLGQPRANEERTPVDVNEAVQQVVDLTVKRCQEENVDVRWEPAEMPLTVEGVPGALHQVLLNVVLNALDAMPDGGTLEISVAEQDGMACVVVADSGVGITAKAAESMFRPFFTTKVYGMGLGLYVSGQIVEQHKGTITAENRPEGGAVFRVCLPTSAGPDTRQRGTRAHA